MLKFAYYALTNPATQHRCFTPIRDILRWPVIFDLISLILQIRDTKRTSQIKDKYAVDDKHHRLVQDYNAKVTLTKKITRTRRAEKFYAVGTQPIRDLSNEKLLIVGPRNIHELFIAWIYGFSWGNIKAIDLYSTNPKIQIMNMEDLEFEDNSFDMVTMASTLSYAEDTERTIAEVARVLNKGGRFIFSAAYDPGSPDYPGDWICGAEIVKYLKAAGLKPYYHQSYDKVNAVGRPQTSHTFAAQKITPDIESNDPVNL